MPAGPLDVLPEPAIVLDAGGRAIAANDLAGAMFGSVACLLERDPACTLGDVSPVADWLADPARATTPDTLVAEANSAMYRAKGASPVAHRGGRRRTD